MGNPFPLKDLTSAAVSAQPYSASASQHPSLWGFCEAPISVSEFLGGEFEYKFNSASHSHLHPS